MDQPQLVITAPRGLSEVLTQEFGCRTTIGVIEQLLLESRRELLVAAPFLSAEQGFLAGEYLYTALQNTLSRRVRVEVFLSKEGAKSLRDAGIDEGKGMLRIYTPREDIAMTSALGSHAKVVIADRERAYIGSANLTNAGLTANFEMGVLITGSSARAARSVWERLVSEGFFILACP